MDFGSEKQSCRLPFVTSGTSQKTPKEPKWNKTYADKCGQSYYHQKWNKKNTGHQGNLKTTTTGNKLKQG